MTPPDTPELHQQQLQRLADTDGGAALVAELSRLPSDPARAFEHQRRIFDAIVRLNDPGAADALARYASSSPHAHFETRAALALAALGDLRAVPHLARRLRLDPLETYGDRGWEAQLRRDDGERVAAARALGDLATLHPEASASILNESEAALIDWTHARPSPHTNGLRSLAILGSHRDIDAWREWADPQVALPLEGQPPPLPEEWVVAHTALRWVGRLRDSGSRDALYASLERRPQGFVATQESALQNGGAILAMTLRSLGVGGAEGLSEWRDPKAFVPLLRHVDEPDNHEESRLAAAAALGWVGSDADLKKLAARLLSLPKAKLELALLYAEALRQRPAAGVPQALLSALTPSRPPRLRQAIARAIGKSQLDAASEKKLTALLKDPQLRSDAALALMLGGSANAAAAGAAAADALQGLGEAWFNSHDQLTEASLSDGSLLRHIRNADAVQAGWAAPLLGQRLQSILYDAGPHSLTRAVLNGRLLAIARGADTESARLAVRAFALLEERGMLLSLSRAEGPAAAAARSERARLVAPADAAAAAARH